MRSGLEKMMENRNSLKSVNDRQSELLRNARAIRAARMSKGLSRRQLAERLGWKAVSIEQIENGRCNFSKERLHKVIEALEFSAEQFENIWKDPKFTVAIAIESGLRDRTVDRKPRRNHYKIVTKEVRVLRILRQKKGVSQTQASRLCGLVPGGFGHIEVGRIELTKSRIEHILSCLGYDFADFSELMNAQVLRDEVIVDANRCLNQLSDAGLTAALGIIKALK
jgi:transcriptional regulator with XRE-family HTH domain